MIDDLARYDTVGFDRLRVTDIWHVDANSAYDVATHYSKSKLTVVVRTFDGAGEIVFSDGEKTLLAAGTLFVFAYKDALRYRCAGARWHFVWAECDGDATILPMRTVIAAPCSETERTESIACINDVSSGTPERASFAVLRLKTRFARIVDEWRESVPASRTAQTAVENAIRRMKDDLTGAPVSAFAAEACYSQRQFREVFRRSTGMSPKCYYDKLRIEHAAQLLLHTTLSVAQTASRLGFSSLFHFSRQFKIRFGVSPLRYRRKNHF